MKGIIVAVFAVTVSGALALPQNAFTSTFAPTQSTENQASSTTTAFPPSDAAFPSSTRAFFSSYDSSSSNQSTTPANPNLDYYHANFIPQNYETACQDQRDAEERNKQLVLTAYQEVFGNQNFDAVDTYFHMDYIQHSPIPPGRQGLKEFAKMYTEGQEKKPVDIRMVSAEWDLVWIHLMSRNKQGEELAIVDIFRVEDELIKEHWNVVQPSSVDLGLSKSVQLF